MIAKSFYGFKAHVEITYDGYIINYVITKASVHDTVETLELITSSPYYQLLVDIGYVGKDLHDFLKNKVSTYGHLIVPIWKSLKNIILKTKESTA